jgi:carboxybiotin decarboxylase
MHWETLWQSMAFIDITWQMVVMWGVCLLLFYLAIYRDFEPLLLVPIAFGALLANLPTEGLINHPPQSIYATQSGIVERIEVSHGQELHVGRSTDEKLQPIVAQLRTEGGDIIPLRAAASGRVVGIPVRQGEQVVAGQEIVKVGGEGIGGLFYYLSQGIILEIFPPLIFLGIGALTDFGPLIANPRTLLLGGAAQLGIFITFIGALALGFSQQEAASIGIIGGADGPTSIYLTNKLAPHLLGPIAVAAYSYMALVPLIQPPIMRALTTPAERKIRMHSLRKVSKLEKLIFILIITIVCILLVPSASALIGMLMLGNLFRESGCTDRLLQSSQNEIINITTIFIGTCVGITMNGQHFLTPQTLKIIALGVVAFGFATAGGVLMAKLMNKLDPKNPINPLIGSAGVSAVPMAARVSQVEGNRADPTNYLLMHAMGPNVAGVIGTALVAGFFIAMLGK